MTGTVAARISAQPFFAALTDTQRAALAEDGMTVGVHGRVSACSARAASPTGSG